MCPRSSSIATSAAGSLAAARASPSSATARSVYPASQAASADSRSSCACRLVPELSRPARSNAAAAVAYALRSRPRAGLLQRGRCGLVRAGRGRGEVPGPAVEVPVGQRRRQRPVRFAALAGRRARVDRRPGQRVAEFHRAGVQRDQPRPLGRGQRPQVDPQPARGPRDRGQVPGVAGRGQHQRPPGGRAELPGAVQERARDPGGHQQRGAFGRQRQVRCQCQVRRVPGQLEQGERVAGRRRVQPPGRLGGQPADQLSGLVAGQAADLEHRQVGAVEQGRLSGPHGDQHGDRVGHQPPEGEQQRLRARPVEPVRVVDQHRHRALIGLGGQQAQRGGADREPVPGRGRAQRQRLLQRGGLGRRDPLDQGQRGAEQFQQRPERDLRLRLDAAGPQQPQAGRLLRGVAEQCRLADPGLPGQCEHAADARPGPGQGLLDPLPLACAAQQHGAIVGT